MVRKMFVILMFKIKPTRSPCRTSSSSSHDTFNRDFAKINTSFATRKSSKGLLVPHAGLKRCAKQAGGQARGPDEPQNTCKTSDVQ